MSGGTKFTELGCPRMSNGNVPRDQFIDERCELAAEAVVAAIGTQCMQASLGDVIEELEELDDVFVDAGGTKHGGAESFIDLSMPNGGNAEVFNLLLRNGFTTEDVETLRGEDEQRIVVTVTRPENV